MNFKGEQSSRLPGAGGANYAPILLLALALGGAFSVLAQRPPLQGPQPGGRPTVGDGLPDGRPGFDRPPPFGAPGFPDDGPRPGGPGGMMREKVKLVEQFDQNGDHRLDAKERQAAREYLQKENAAGRGRRGPGGPGGRRGGFGGRGGNQEPAQPGPHVAVAEVKSFAGAPLFDSNVVRTFFLEFTGTDWEQELADFKNTDVEVPAKLTVDGKSYAGVGVHFHGASSFMMVGAGRKHSLHLSLDFVHKDQNLAGYRSINLLNSHEDPTFLRAVLYCEIAREYIPAPRAGYVRVVINGECWGVYASVEQFNKEFIKEWFGTTQGARWKVPGSPRGRGSLAYLGEDAQPYKRIYEIKTKDDPKSWADLIRLCKVLNQTPGEQLEKALAPLLDIDGALKFLALENVFVNNDGYWIRTSDYNLYQDEKGRFHVIPHDVNETFLTPEGPGFGGGPGRGGRPGLGIFQERGAGPEGVPEGAPGFVGRPAFNPAARINGVELDPLIAANDAGKPLLSKLLAVPSLRSRYLGYVRDMADRWLDWKKLGPVALQHHSLIADAVKADTRKLYSTDAFLRGVTEDTPTEEGQGGPGGSRSTISLKHFAEQRRAYLLNHAEVKKSAP